MQCFDLVVLCYIVVVSPGYAPSFTACQLGRELTAFHHLATLGRESLSSRILMPAADVTMYPKGRWNISARVMWSPAKYVCLLSIASYASSFELKIFRFSWIFASSGCTPDSGLRTFSVPIAVAYGSKLQISILAACSNFAFPLRSFGTSELEGPYFATRYRQIARDSKSTKPSSSCNHTPA